MGAGAKLLARCAYKAGEIERQIRPLARVDRASQQFTFHPASEAPGRFEPMVLSFFRPDITQARILSAFALRFSAVEFAELKFLGDVLYDLISQPS